MHLDLGHCHVHKQESLIFNYPDSYLKYTLETAQNTEVAFILIFQIKSVSYRTPEAVLGFPSFMTTNKESTNLDGWIKFRIIKSHHSPCVRKIETNIKLHRLFLGEKE